MTAPRYTITFPDLTINSVLGLSWALEIGEKLPSGRVGHVPKLVAKTAKKQLAAIWAQHRRALAEARARKVVLK